MSLLICQFHLTLPCVCPIFVKIDKDFTVNGKSVILLDIKSSLVLLPRVEVNNTMISDGVPVTNRAISVLYVFDVSMSASICFLPNSI